MAKLRSETELVLTSLMPISLSLSSGNKQSREMDRLAGFRIWFRLLQRETSLWGHKGQVAGISLTSGLLPPARGSAPCFIAKVQTGSPWAEPRIQTWLVYTGLKNQMYALVFPFPFEKWKLWENKISGQPCFRCPCEKIMDAFELWCWRLLRVAWAARRSNQSILKEINPEYSLEGLMLKLKLQYFGHLMRRVDQL